MRRPRVGPSNCVHWSNAWWASGNSFSEFPSTSIDLSQLQMFYHLGWLYKLFSSFNSFKVILFYQTKTCSRPQTHWLLLQLPFLTSLLFLMSSMHLHPVGSFYSLELTTDTFFQKISNASCCSSILLMTWLMYLWSTFAYFLSWFFLFIFGFNIELVYHLACCPPFFSLFLSVFWLNLMQWGHYYVLMLTDVDLCFLFGVLSILCCTKILANFPINYLFIGCSKFCNGRSYKCWRLWWSTMEVEEPCSFSWQAFYS